MDYVSDIEEYIYDIERLSTGGSYGNLCIFAKTDRETNLEKLWLAADNQCYVKKWIMNFYLDGQKLKASKTIFKPALQKTIFEYDSVILEKTLFLPYKFGYLQSLFFVLEVKNRAKEHKEIHVVTNMELVTNEGEKARIAKLSDTQLMIDTYQNRAIILDFKQIPLSYRFTKQGIKLSSSISVSPESKSSIFLICTIAEKDNALTKSENNSLNYVKILEDTQKSIDQVLQTAYLFTPDPIINRGLQWAKVNMLRVQHKFPIGFGFTNDPPLDVLVIRDAAWYILGADYVTPEFSRGMIEVINKYGISKDGKVIEYIRCSQNPPKIEDYGLNINDDTPLFIYSVYHHYVCTKDDKFLRSAYPRLKRIADYILSQTKDGLVFCDTDGTNAWGICGWRNVIPDYTQNGIVTEINAECFKALEVTSKLAYHLGKDKDGARFESEALRIKELINKRLISRTNHLYLLNIDKQGRHRDTLTGDLIFPVIFDVANKNMSDRILNRLYCKDFWTDFGVRTVSKEDPTYDPNFGSQSVGGVWPNLTAWVAYGCRNLHQDRLVEAMRNIYKISEVPNPKKRGTIVPGEFPEMLDGENLTSKGMPLSPWMPPTYLWLGLEGLAGIEPDIDGLTIAPKLPPQWSWIAAKDVCYAGKRLTFFVNDGTLYTNIEVETKLKKEILSNDVTQYIKANTYHIGLKSDNELVVFLATENNKDVRVKIDATLLDHEEQFCFRLLAGTAKIIKLLTGKN